MFALCVCSVCSHGDHFSVLYCVCTVLQVSRFVSIVAFGDYHAHDNARRHVCHYPALFTLDIFPLLLNKKIFNPGGEVLLEKVPWCARAFLVF